MICQVPLFSVFTAKREYQLMNLAEKIAKIVEKYGSLTEITLTHEAAVLGFPQTASGQLEIIDAVNNCWQVTFVCHGLKSFFCDGVARCAFFRKEDGNCGNKHLASVVNHVDSNSKPSKVDYTDEKKVMEVYNKIAAIIEFTYSTYCSKE